MKSVGVSLIVLFLLLITMLAGGEMYLRRKLPYYNTTPLQPSCRQDETLGWVNKQVEIEMPSFSKNRETIMVKQTRDGRRVTSKRPFINNEKHSQLVVVGGSLTYGFGLSDEESWPWLLQQETPCAQVLNYGTPGYGTYQCLLMLERVLPALSSPKIVLYGFLEHHLVRNVAPPGWRAMLNMKRREKVFLPYVDIDGHNQLIRVPPVQLKRWPFSQSLSTVRFAEIMYRNTFQSREYFEKMDAAWEQLMINMRDRCADHGCRFVVVLLNITHRNEKVFYTNFLRNNNIEYIDADFEIPPEKLPEMMLEKDPTHPNEKTNAIWADIIGQHIVCRDDHPVVLAERLSAKQYE